MDLYFYGVDIGYGNTKAHWMSDYSESFKAGVVLDSNSSSITDSSRVITFNGVDYRYGEPAETTDEDMTQSPSMLLKTLVCIGLDMEKKGLPDEINVALGIGLPLKKSGDRELRQRNEKYFAETYRDCTFQLHGHTYTVHFVYVKCFPQTQAIFATLKKSYFSGPEYADFYLADLGAHTFDLEHIVNGSPVSNELFSEKLGVNHMFHKIRDDLAAMRNPLHEETIQLVLEGTVIRNTGYKEVKRLCDSQKNEYFDKLTAFIRAHVNTHMPIVWTGGGYFLIKSLPGFKESFQEIFTDEDISPLANAKAFKALVEAFYEKEAR